MTEALYTQSAYNIVYDYRQTMQTMYPRMGASFTPGTAHLSEMQIAVLEPGPEGEKMTSGVCSDPIKHEEKRKHMRERMVGHKFSEESKQKMSAAKKGKPFSEKHRNNLSLAHTGRKGRMQSEETKRKLSEAQKGERSPCYGKKLPESTRLKMSISQKGKTRSEETRKKMGAAKKGKPQTPEQKRKNGEAHKGEKSSCWKGGISYLPYCPKFTREFKERVRAFFGYRCVECGVPQNGNKLHVHHVNFRKDACCAEDAIPLFVPLCISCHPKTNHNRIFWEYWFTEMINHLHGGYCYFTKEEFFS